MHLLLLFSIINILDFKYIQFNSKIYIIETYLSNNYFKDCNKNIK